ncbi:MAG: hypothetical protein AAGA54_09930 [Myxococcota bacterium]
MPQYRVALRHTTLVESATLEPRADDRYFISTAAPPPTHSILTLHDADETRYFLVDQVIEVKNDDSEPGIVGKLTDAQAHEEASQLGTEHLEDGEMVGGDDVAPQMAMPAPVVDPDPSEDVDESERARLEAAEREGAADEAAAAGDDAPAESAEASSDAGAETAKADEGGNEGQSNNSGNRRGRRRRGRKRR